jgi:hypothetical protein
MSKLPVRRTERAPRKVEQAKVEVIEPASSANPFVSFRYSYKEISASGGKARVKSRSARFEDGKLTSETFEGELDRSAYERMVGEAQHQLLAQTALLMNSLSRLLPFARKHRPDPD